ncbi:MAG: YlxR family protein [Clostridia bacterium]|nr:YlxR family protein [Clostridia bacterium]
MQNRYQNQRGRVLSVNNVKVRKIPLRRCAGCGESFPKRELIRIVRTPEGVVTADETGKMNGRGVYVCRNSVCFSKIRKQKKLDKSLETNVPEEVYEQIGTIISAEAGKAL